MKYRSEIDGLRAVAVTSVILFHANAPFISGGFVGVDIFFVISGFLITLSILKHEGMSPGERIARFYDSRIRRILPALTLVLAVVLAEGVVFLLPDELNQLGKSAAASALFVSNLWSWTQVGYFAPQAESMPLLHTWSLAIEEQFYIVFPLLMIVLGRWRRSVSLQIIAALAVLSFGITLYLTRHSPACAFYWPTRAWELLVGAMLALADIRQPRLREAASLAGVALIALSLFVLDRTTAFPGSAALAPVIGAAAIIYGGGGTIAGRVLSSRPLVWIGLISYSLYLWHWPVLVFAKQAAVVTQLSPAQTIGCIALTLVLATLSWSFVETPFRSRQLSKRRLFAGAGATLGGVVAAGMALVMVHGLPSRFSQEALSQANAELARRPAGCVVGLDRFTCRTGTREPTFILWGDSHAGTLSPAMSAAAGANGLYATFGGCPPLPGLKLEALRGDDKSNCATHNRAVLAHIRADKNIKLVVLAGWWTSPTYPIAREDVKNVLDALSDKRVVVIGDNPTPDFLVPRVLALKGEAKIIRPSRFPPAFDVMGDYPNVAVLQLSDALCDGDVCAPSLDSRALYADTNHLSRYAAETVVAAFLKDELPRLAADANKVADSRREERAGRSTRAASLALR